MRTPNAHHRVAASLAALLLVIAAPAWSQRDAEPRAERAPDDDAWDLQQRLERQLADDVESRLREVAAPEPVAPTSPTPAMNDPALRREKVDAHRPELTSARARDAIRFLPANLERALHVREGRLYELLSLYDESRDAYATAIAQGDNAVDTWRGLGRMRLRSGDL